MPEPKTLYTVEFGVSVVGWQARLREDDSLIITLWSVIPGDTTGRKYRHYNTGILRELQKDPELEPEAAIETWLANHAGDSGKLLSCGHKVR